MPENQITTAATIVAYYQELIKGGIDPAIAGSMARDAADWLIRNFDELLIRRGDVA